MKKVLKTFFILLFFCLVLITGSRSSNALAAGRELAKSVVIVNPIRGHDFWTINDDISDIPKKEYEVISKNNLPATWLVRYDALREKNIVDFLKLLDNQQETGVFMEVTPSLTDAAGVIYNKSPNWHYAQSVLLVGYSPEDRRKLIDTVFNKYHDTFNSYPKSVGAWWIDAYSLNYMKQKYGIQMNLDVADQYSTDQYQVWGQYWSTPFYPAKQNALMPAGSVDQKIGVVTIQWASRDPYNAYGNGVTDSTYSVQVNDYLLHKLDTKYFEKLLDIYPQTTFGLENDFDWNSGIGDEYTKVIEAVVQRKTQNNLLVKNMVDFGNYYKSVYPGISPDVLIEAKDPLGSEGRVVWYQTPKYRIGWFYGPYGSAIRDLRLFNDSLTESCYATACKELNLAVTATKALDDVTFQTRWVIDEGKISDFKLDRMGDKVELSYKNQAGSPRSIKLYPNDIQVDGKIQPVSFAILNAVNISQTSDGTKVNLNLGTKIDYKKFWPNFLLNSLKFLVLTIFFFLIPGWLISKRWLLAIPVGWVLFTFLSFITGLIHQDKILWLIPILGILSLTRVKFYLPHRVNFGLKEIGVGLVMMSGSATWLMTTVKNGLFFDYGLGYWGPNGHDAIWHLALISQLQRNFPPQNPIFAGAKLTNYHYFFDLLLAKSGSLFAIDSQDLLFRLFPMLLTLLSGLLMYRLVRSLYSGKYSYLAALVATFLLYFGTSFGFIVSYFRDKSLGGESMFWAQQAISTLLNPPFAISIILLMSGLILFKSFEQTENKRLSEVFKLETIKQNTKITIPLILVWGLLIEFKAYGGILVLAALAILTFENILVKKDYKYLGIFIPTLILSLIVFLPNNTGSQRLLEWSPLWLVKTMVDSQDRLSWQRLGLALDSGVLFKQLVGYSLATLIFLVGNLGTRSLGLFNKENIKLSRIYLYIVLIGTIIPLLFVQKGNNWNIIQFFYYSSFIMAIWSAIFIAKAYRVLGTKLGIILLILIGLLTIPTNINTMEQYLPARSPARLPMPEFEALEFLKAQKPGTVMTLGFDPNAKLRLAEPLPLYAYTSTAYVSAFSNHPVFLEDTINLEILGIDYKGRLNLQRDFAKVRERSKDILKENNISYVYVLKSQNFEEDENKMGIKKIFENDEVKIFKVL